MAKTKNNETLTMKHKIGYGMGDAGGCMTFALMTGIFSSYCTDILAIPAGVLAVIVLIWNIWDAVNDPMMGALMDKMFAKNKNPKGKFRPWLFRATPIIAICFALLFTVPALVDGIASIAMLFVLKLAYEAGYTMFNIPMGSLLSAMANTDGERAALSSARGFGSMVGNMVPLMVFPMILEAFKGSATGYSIAATVCAAIGAVMCFGHYFLTEERNVSETPAEVADNIKLTDIFNVFRVNRPFVALCIHGICMCTMQNLASALSVYMYKDVFGRYDLLAMATVVSAPMGLIFYVFGPMAARKLGLEKMIRLGLLSSIVLFGSLFGLHCIMDVNPWVHIVWSGLATGFSSMSVIFQWGLVGEAIDYNEYVTGKRTEGSIYGTFNLTRRIGNTIGTSSALAMLALTGYISGAATQAAGVIFGIKVLCVLLPGIFALGSWAAFKFVWNITPETREKMAAFKAGQTE